MLAGLPCICFDFQTQQSHPLPRTLTLFPPSRDSSVSASRTHLVELLCCYGPAIGRIPRWCHHSPYHLGAEGSAVAPLGVWCECWKDSWARCYLLPSWEERSWLCFHRASKRCTWSQQILNSEVLFSDLYSPRCCQRTAAGKCPPPLSACTADSWSPRSGWTKGRGVALAASAWPIQLCFWLAFPLFSRLGLWQALSQWRARLALRECWLFAQTQVFHRPTQGRHLWVSLQQQSWSLLLSGFGRVCTKVTI